jgi:hypothetical protein
MMQTYKIAIGGKNLGVCENHEFTWPVLVEKLTTHRQSDNKTGAWFVGGSVKGTKRSDSEMVSRSVLTYDIDNSGMSLASIQYELIMNLDCAWLAYSTFSHTDDNPKVRVVIPLSKVVSPSQYKALSIRVAEEMGVPVDPASHVPAQAMFSARCKDISKAWSFSQDGAPYEVAQPLALVSSSSQTQGLKVASNAQEDADLDDAVRGLELAVKNIPIDVSDYDVQSYLDAYPAELCDYHAWFNVCTALYHQYQGSDIGFNLFYSWSLAGNETKNRDELRAKWDSLEGGAGTLTFASIIYAVKGSGAQVLLEASGMSAHSHVFEQLLVDASDVSNLEEYEALKVKLLAIPTYKLGGDLRGMLASELAQGFGKMKGITKGQIAKAITPSGKVNGISVEDTPSWVTDWVYVETECQFYNISKNYGIRREAFDAKYNREADCVAAGISASVLALVEYKIPVVVGQLFWPGCGTLMRWQGKAMVNTYRAHDIVAVREYDPEGLNAVRMFEAQLNMLLPNKREQGLLLNWLAFVYQNPGKRLNWSIILQGTQGSGKTFFSDVLKMIMGSNVRELAASAIGGRFSGWATGCLLNVVEEIRVNGVNRYEIMDAIKPFITNSEVGIERKGKDHETVPNFTSYLFLTNHKDAVPIVDGDRRYCILFSKIQTEEQLFSIFGGEVSTGLYFEKLYNVMRANTGAMAKYFTDYVIPAEFKPYGRAPATDGKVEMAGLSISEPRQILEDLLDRHRSELINDEFIDTTELNKMCIMGGDDVPKTRSLSSILLEKGFRQIKGRFFRTYKPDVRHCIWIKEGLDDEYAINKIKAYLDDSY